MSLRATLENRQSDIVLSMRDYNERVINAKERLSSYEIRLSEMAAELKAIDAVLTTLPADDEAPAGG